MTYSYKGITNPTQIAAEKAKDSRIAIDAMGGRISPESGGWGRLHPSAISGSHHSGRNPITGKPVLGSTSRTNGSNVITSTKISTEKINENAKIKLEKSRSRTKLIEKLCKEFNEHVANGTALSYCNSLSQNKQIDFMRFLHDVYNYSGVPTSDDEITKIDASNLLSKSSTDIQNGKFQNYIKEHHDAVLEQLNDFLEDIHKYELKQERIKAKQTSLEKRKARYQRMTPYRKIANVVTPVLSL
jgi:hypothetical protein